ncbi:hypothetical protein Zm00014a_009009 [Zea mays]|uniref:Uncharacterized protein n=1 Tax=Zea mays TaxID=4577 RepID=A0A317YD34_MAIZE|nr:hypothetical protein Zm00014a_009009 [Zea mays]
MTLNQTEHKVGHRT